MIFAPCRSSVRFASALFPASHTVAVVPGMGQSPHELFLRIILYIKLSCRHLSATFAVDSFAGLLCAPPAAAVNLLHSSYISVSSLSRASERRPSGSSGEAVVDTRQHDTERVLHVQPVQRRTNDSSF